MHKSRLQKTRNKNKQYKKLNHVYLIHTWSDKAFKGTVIFALRVGHFKLRLQSFKFLSNHVGNKNYDLF